MDGPPVVAAVGLRKTRSTAVIKPTDAVHIGSCTKAITASLIGHAIQNGLLSYTTPIGAIDPAWRKTSWGLVTVGMLLCHESGLPANVDWWGLSRTAGTDALHRSKVLDRLDVGRKHPTAPAVFQYSNLGYTVLGRLIDRVYGMPFEEVVELLVARPLGLQTLGFGPPGRVIDGEPDAVWGHKINSDVYEPTQHDNPPLMNPAGRVHLSVYDWLRWLSCQTYIRLARQHPSALSALRKLHTPSPKGQYAGGWVLQTRKWAKGVALVHTGSNTYWAATAWVAPETGVVLVTVANADSTAIQEGLDRIFGVMIRQVVT